MRQPQRCDADSLSLADAARICLNARSVCDGSSPKRRLFNEEDAPTGRPAGSLMWAGLANLFYWADRKNGIGGYWGSQILPFQEVSSYAGFVDFETAVYSSLRR